MGAGPRSACCSRLYRSSVSLTRLWSLLAELVALLFFLPAFRVAIDLRRSPYVTDAGEVRNALRRWGLIHHCGCPPCTTTGLPFVSLLSASLIVWWERLLGRLPVIVASFDVSERGRAERFSAVDAPSSLGLELGNGVAVPGTELMRQKGQRLLLTVPARALRAADEDCGVTVNLVAPDPLTTTDHVTARVDNPHSGGDGTVPPAGRTERRDGPNGRVPFGDAAGEPMADPAGWGLQQEGRGRLRAHPLALPIDLGVLIGS